MRTITYTGEHTVPALLTFMCNEFLPEEDSIDPTRWYCNESLAHKCLKGSAMSDCMLYMNKGPKATDKLPENTMAYLEEGEKL